MDFALEFQFLFIANNLFFSLCVAYRELQRMAPALFHLLPLVGRLFRAQHVCGGGRGEFPSLQRGTGEGGEGPTCRQEGQEAREEETK